VEEREKQGRPENTYHVNDVWWMQGGASVGLAQAHPNKMNLSHLSLYIASLQPG